MKSGKFLIIAILFLVSLLCLSAVSAADDAASDVIADTIDEPILEESIDDADLGDSENEELGEIDENVLNENSQTNLANSNDEDDSLGAVAVASFSYIKDEVQRHDELNFTYDVLYSKEYGDEGLEDGIPITKDCTIDGHGNTISGSNQARIFYVNGAHLTIKNLNLKNGIAEWGGAIFVYNGASLTVINCTFSNNVADVVDYSQGGLHVPEAGAILVKYNSNCNIIDSRFEGNTANVSGGALVGCYNSNINIVNSTFTNNGVINDYPADWAGGDAIIAYEGTNLVISKSTFESNNAGNAQLSAIKSSGSSVTVSDSSFSNEDGIDGGAVYAGSAINCTFNGNTADYGGAMYGGSAINCTFNGNSADEGGAMYGGSATNCTFIDNHAVDGGAMYGGSATNCTFAGNNAENGGALYQTLAKDCGFHGNNAYNAGGGHGGAMYGGSAINSIFNSNYAYYGGAVYAGSAINCTFNGNSGDYGAAIAYGTAVNCSFNSNNAEGNGQGGAIFNGSAVNCTFTSNNAQYRGGAIYIGSAVNCIFTGNTANYGGAICGNMETGELSTADSCIFNGDTCYLVNLYQPVLNAFNFISTYGDGQKLVVNFTSNGGMPIANANIKVDVYTTAREFIGTYNILSGGWNLPFNAGNYIAVYNATDFDIDTVEGIIVINKAKSTISSKAVTAIYNNNKYLVITLKDAYGKAIKNAKVTVTLASAKTYTTDKNGQIKINVGKLVPKTYTAKIKFAGNTNLLASSTTAKVTVKKATPKMTAKAKTFKIKVKTKKYTITLKNNKGKVLKSTKVTLKVNKKTFTAKTNKKGVATFKITNLKKKGKFTAVVKFAGNKYYNKLTKKVKITVKK